MPYLIYNDEITELMAVIASIWIELVQAEDVESVMR